MRGPHPGQFRRRSRAGEPGSWRAAPGTQSSRPLSPPAPRARTPLRAGSVLAPVPELHFEAGWDIPPERWEGGCEPEGGGTRLTGSDLLREKGTFELLFSPSWELNIYPDQKGTEIFFFFLNLFFMPPTHFS